MQALILVGVGGFIGANVRYWLTVWLTQALLTRFQITFPAATLLINFTGSILLAAFTAWSMNRVQMSPNVRLFIATGFFGAYTTFSTFANDSVALARAGDWVGAVTNVAGTNMLCIVGVVIGLAIGSRL